MGKQGRSALNPSWLRIRKGAVEVEVDGLYTSKHVPPDIFRTHLGLEIWDEYITFTFVRNL
jgi:hypothetical protein